MNEKRNTDKAADKELKRRFYQAFRDQEGFVGGSLQNQAEIKHPRFLLYVADEECPASIAARKTTTFEGLPIEVKVTGNISAGS